MFEVREEEGETPSPINTKDQLIELHFRLRKERNVSLKAAIEVALSESQPSKVMTIAKKRYEECKDALDFVEFLQKKLPGWESAVKEE